MPSTQTYASILYQKRRIILVSGLIGLVFALAVSLFQPLEYRAEASVLVIPRFAGDGYQATRSAEKYATTLTSVLSSMSFYEKVVAADPSVATVFSGTDVKIRKAWGKAIDGSVKPDTGILNLAVYAKDQDTSEDILATAIRVLENDGASYLGGNASVLLYTINQPIVSRFPARPNYPVNVFGGLVLGMLASVVVIVLRNEFQLAQPTPVVRAMPRRAFAVQQEAPTVDEPKPIEMPEPNSDLPSVRELMKQRFGYEPQEIQATVHEPKVNEQSRDQEAVEAPEQRQQFNERLEDVSYQQESQQEPRRDVFTPNIVNLLKLNRDLRGSEQWSATAHSESGNA